MLHFSGDSSLLYAATHSNIGVCVEYHGAMSYDLAIFDMDGTLSDSLPFFVSVQNTLAARHGFRAISADQVDAARHWTPQQAMRHAGLPKWKLPWVAKDFIGMMKESASAVRPFDGVDEVLKDLHDRGVSLALVTSNSAENARNILGAETLRRFAFVDGGASIFGKARRIRRAVKNCAVPAERAIYVGDQTTDGEAASKAGVAFGAVAWGFGSVESLMTCQPTEVYATVHDLKRIAVQR